MAGSGGCVVTPAERLRAAADTIERTANGTTSGEWGTDGDFVWSATPGTGYSEDITGAGMNPSDAAHVALWDPPTALLAVRWLRTTALYLETANHLGSTADHDDITLVAAAFADRILTGDAS